MQLELQKQVLMHLKKGGKMTDENKIYCCPECNSDDILFLSWCDEHGKMIRGYDDPFNTCQSCHNQFVIAKEKKEVA